MTYQTDERLKSYLDTNQLSRERLCLAVLAINKRFTKVRPRHPRGGPDGARDIEAVYRSAQLTFGAVGFANQANESDEQKKRIFRKFEEDLAGARRAEPKMQAFVFFTNLNLTIDEKDTLKDEAKSIGLSYCDIFDRERIRISLDSPDGFSIRFQYLDILLSAEEQSSFFARWGDDIQEVIATGFQQMSRTLNRILFLQEATDVLDELSLYFELDKTYSAGEIEHFRAFCIVLLKEIRHNILKIAFGSTDKVGRMSDTLPDQSDISGIANGISGGQWEQHVTLPDESVNGDIDHAEIKQYIKVGNSGSVGMSEVRFITSKYHHDQFVRTIPRLSLKDLDQAMVMPVLNLSLAEKLKTIHVYANGYKLLEIKRSDSIVDSTSFEMRWLTMFTEVELADPWVRIRPSDMASSFAFRFYEQTPRRSFSSEETIDSFANKVQPDRNDPA